MSKVYFNKKQRKIIENRAKKLCEYCLMLQKYISCVNEHIIAIIRGGSNNLDNIANACGGCNNHKYDRIEGFDEISQQIVPLFHPRKDNWATHFCWSEDFLTIKGLTPTARVTVDLLKMNRPILINLRTVLLLSGEHPPV